MNKKQSKPNQGLSKEELIWKEIMVWGAKAENQKMFDKLSEYFILPQRLPVDPKLADQYGGIKDYLLYCEAQGNVIRSLQSLKVLHEQDQEKLAKQHAG